jgi:Uma2 family endonuclease
MRLQPQHLADELADLVRLRRRPHRQQSIALYSATSPRVSMGWPPARRQRIEPPTIDRRRAPGYAAVMKQAPLTLRRWRRVEYERLVDLGAFEDGEPVELIGGQLIVAEPKGSEHATGVEMASDALRAALPAGWIVRGQNPISLDDESAPEPDIAVVRGSLADYRHAHPARPALIIEVAETSLGFDRVEKGSLYARAGIADYWVVNLVDRVLEVYRDPGADLTAPYAGATCRWSGWRRRA